MSGQDGSALNAMGLGGADKPTTITGIALPPQQQQQIAIQQKTTSGTTTTTFPIDLASAKIGHVKSIEAIKVTPVMQGGVVGGPQTATFRTISGVPGSSVRVMMPSASLMPQAMIKQLDPNAIRTQISQIPGRTLSNTSITVTRPAAQAAYIPRTGTGAANIQTQRLVTPIRAQTPPIATANFIRSATVARNSSSPATSVITPATTTWMGGTGQVQLLRTISHPQKQRIVTQNITTSGNCGSAAVVAIGQPTNISAGQTQIQQQTQQGGNQSTIQTVTSQQGQQQAFIASLAPRQQTATLVYSNVTSSQGQQYTPTAGGQRFAVAASLANNQRQIRPIQLAKTFSAAKLGVGGMNATSISIRAPNIPVLTPTITPGSGSVQRSNTNIQTNNLSTARIIQVQQQPGAGQQIIGTGTQQIIGSASRITNGVMLQPIIMNTQSGGKIGIRQPGTVTTKVQQPALTITQLGLSKLPSGQQVSTAVSLQGATITPSSANSNNSQQPITQIVNVTGGSILTQNIASSATVVPLMTTRTSNVLAGTITSIKSSASAPQIGKVITQQVSHAQSGQGQVAEIMTSSHSQPANVYIHARPANSSGTTTVIPSTGTSTFLPSGAFFYESVPANAVSSGVLSLTTTTVTSTISSNPTIASTSLAYNPGSATTFSVVQSNNRTIGQIQIPSSTSATVCSTANVAQIQTVPVRFTPDQTITLATTSTAPPTHQIIHNPPQSQHHQVITVPQQQLIMPIKLPNNSSTTITTAPTVQPSTRVASIVGVSGIANLSSVSSAFLRKRDEGSPIRAAKNLAPTLLSMGSMTPQSQPTPPPPPPVPPVIAASEQKKPEREPRAISPHSRPPSSDGSTTVSVNSSPDIDQQMNRELHFNPINDMYANHQNQPPSGTSHTNGGLEGPPNKKSRRSTNDSQQSAQSVSSTLQPPSVLSSLHFASSAFDAHKGSSGTLPHSNKENAKPTEFVLRKPRSCTLLNTYKQNWKPANNHFNRYSDVKPREDRRPTVIDLSNQACVAQKINGWKIHHLSAQMEDLCEIETQVFDKLSGMLKLLEADEQNADIDRINELVKGNIQRSKIIVDGVTEARNQIMKIFDHKSHVSDIIHRCASKRNFKKREKT